jgi:hypothetical protein
MKEFDFGFSHVDETDIPNVKIEKDRAEQMYNAIMPLLNNLKANPQKDIIKWPNREAKINEFIDRLDYIMGKEKSPPPMNRK